MNSEQIKQKAEEAFPKTYVEWGVVLDDHWHEMKRDAYLRCWEENCLPIQKENEKLRAKIAEVADLYTKSKAGKSGIAYQMYYYLIEALSGEGNGVASEK